MSSPDAGISMLQNKINKRSNDSENVEAAFRTMGKRKIRWDEKSDEQVFMNNLK